MQKAMQRRTIYLPKYVIDEIENLANQHTEFPHRSGLMRHILYEQLKIEEAIAKQTKGFSECVISTIYLPPEWIDRIKQLDHSTSPTEFIRQALKKFVDRTILEIPSDFGLELLLEKIQKMKPLESRKIDGFSQPPTADTMQESAQPELINPNVKPQRSYPKMQIGEMVRDEFGTHVEIQYLE